MAVYAVFLAATPFEHHDLLCELKTPLHCTACTSSVLGSDSFKSAPAGTATLTDFGLDPVICTLTGMTEVLGNRPYTIHLTNRTPAMRKALDALEEERKKSGRRFKVKFRDKDSSSVRITLTKG